MLATIAINLAISLVPALILFGIWRERAWLMTLPTGLSLVVLLVAQALPDDFAPFSKTDNGWGYVLIAAIVAAFAAHCALLYARDYSLRDIVVAEFLQLYTWITLWFVIGTTLQGGK